MYTRQITSEETYTLLETKRIIKAEQLQKREKFLYKTKQKFMGLLCITLSVVAPILLDGDATISLVTIPLGFYLIFTKEDVVL